MVWSHWDHSTEDWHQQFDKPVEFLWLSWRPRRKDHHEGTFAPGILPIQIWSVEDPRNQATVCTACGQEGVVGSSRFAQGELWVVFIWTGTFKWLCPKSSEWTDTGSSVSHHLALKNESRQIVFNPLGIWLTQMKYLQKEFENDVQASHYFYKQVCQYNVQPMIKNIHTDQERQQSGHGICLHFGWPRFNPQNNNICP